jgi:hypothetical protein
MNIRAKYAAEARREEKMLVLERISVIAGIVLCVAGGMTTVAYLETTITPEIVGSCVFFWLLFLLLVAYGFLTAHLSHKLLKESEYHAKNIMLEISELKIENRKLRSFASIRDELITQLKGEITQLKHGVQAVVTEQQELQTYSPGRPVFKMKNVPTKNII